MIKQTEIRHAIICNLKASGDYIYKSYTDEEQLKKGIERFERRLCKPEYRTAKIKITIEEVRS